MRTAAKTHTVETLMAVASDKVPKKTSLALQRPLWEKLLTDKCQAGNTKSRSPSSVGERVIPEMGHPQGHPFNPGGGQPLFTLHSQLHNDTSSSKQQGV